MSGVHVRRIQVETAPVGDLGQRHLASGEQVAMMLWTAEPPIHGGEEFTREYETVGFVISGHARLRIDGETMDLWPGDCWVVPAGAPHAYDFLEPFTAIEATSPPAPVRSVPES